MILENGLVKITDFGIAMAMNATQLTQTNSVMGSVHYLPPEQANGKGATLQSDIYSMGILMFELLTGTLPYRGDNAIEIALKHLKEPLPSIKDELPNLPQSVENVILKAVAKNPKNRYADARAMHEDLETCLESSRKDEPRWVYKYAEGDNSDAKSLKIMKEPKIEVKENKKEASSDAPVVKKITGEEMKKQNKLLIALVSIFTGIVVLITTVFVLIPVITNKATIDVPDVTGLTESEAVKKLQDAGFVVSEETEDISSSEIEEGKVAKTSPVAGSKRKKDSEIKLYMSIGDTTITIEDYTGKSYLEVKGALEAQGLLVSIEKQDVEDNEDIEIDENKVIGQSIESGEKVTEGTQIILYIPNKVTQYPDFTDGTWSISDVEEFAENYELTVEIEEVETSEYEEGDIFYQSKPEGYDILKGTSFKIKVAKASVLDEEEESEIW